MGLFFFGLAAVMFLGKFEACADELLEKKEHKTSYHIPKYKRPRKTCVEKQYDCKPIWK